MESRIVDMEVTFPQRERHPESSQRRRISAWMLDALFPRFCLRCGREGTLWCNECDAAWVPTPPPLMRPATTHLDGLISATLYGDPIVRRGIGAWKYDGDPQAGATVARWVRRSTALNALPFLPDAVVAVPLSVVRRRARGFDQAEVLARQVSETLCVPYVPLLSRVRHGSPRAKIGRSDRRIGDLEGSFVARSVVPARILLVDDVFTSGATMDAAAACLKRAGAVEVWGFTVARG